MAKDSFELTIASTDPFHENETRQMQLCYGDLALMPYLKTFGPKFMDDSAYIGVVVDGGEMHEQNYVKFEPFYYLNLSLQDNNPIQINSKRYKCANSILESSIPAIIAGTPQEIAKRLKHGPYKSRFDMFSDFIRKIQAPYDSSLERLIENFARTSERV